MGAAKDPYSLVRFREAQAGGVYERALGELREGRKRSHWMWFVFPQIAGLGQSETSRRYAIGSLAEARAYLADGLLGERLRECAHVLCELPDHDAIATFGQIDALKLRSSMTLFARAAAADGEEDPFARVLDLYFAGVPDPATERLIPPGPS